MSTIWLCRSCLNFSCVFDRPLRTNSFVSSMILFVLSFFVFSFWLWSCFTHSFLFYCQTFFAIFFVQTFCESFNANSAYEIYIWINWIWIIISNIAICLSLASNYICCSRVFFFSLMYWCRLWCNLLDHFHQNLLQILEICEWLLPMPVLMGSNEHYNMF